jgi:RNA polymerase sigma-70 factor (ECF subfamily)
VPDGPTTNDDWQVLISEQATRYGVRYHRIALGILHDVQAAHDVCQEAFLKAWAQRGGIVNERALPGWLARVVVNESMAVLRRRRTEDRLLSPRPPSSGEGGPSAALDRSELCGRVRLAVAELPEPTRTIVVMRLMQGMPGQEVKAMLGISASEVSRRLHAGMEALRHVLG